MNQDSKAQVVGASELAETMLASVDAMAKLVDGIVALDRPRLSKEGRLRVDALAGLVSVFHRTVGDYCELLLLNPDVLRSDVQDTSSQ